MPKHGVFATEQATSVLTPAVADVSIPFVVGTAPIHAADNPATPGVPVLCTSWDEAVDQLGYNEAWDKYTLCEFMYSHFQLYSMQPVIFLNVFDPASMKTAVAADNHDVEDHKVNLGIDAFNDSALVVKSGDTALVKGTDYEVYFSDGDMIIELLSTGTYYAVTTLNIAYNKANTAAVTTSAVATAVGNVDLCMSTVGLIPDLILAPGFSSDSGVAAVMASKAEAINGLFRAKALVDIPCDATSGATVYSAVIAKKSALNMVDLNQIPCWPMVALGGKKFHLSTQLAGLMASVDSDTGTPYASPSNHVLRIDSLILADGSEVLQTKEQADILNAGGIVTALNFMNTGFVAWGNYTACYPGNQDVKDYFIPVSRMFDFVANTLIRTFWGQLDKPMTSRFIETILDTCNIWLNGLVGAGYLLGARCEMHDNENPLTNLMAGIVKLHIYITPPVPAQEIDFVLEYDASYVTAALQA